MKAFLIVMIVIGAWNLISFIARVISKEISYQYVGHIILGIWALIIFWGWSGD